MSFETERTRERDSSTQAERISFQINLDLEEFDRRAWNSNPVAFAVHIWRNFPGKKKSWKSFHKIQAKDLFHQGPK